MFQNDIHVYVYAIITKISLDGSYIIVRYLLEDLRSLFHYLLKICCNLSLAC